MSHNVQICQILLEIILNHESLIPTLKNVTILRNKLFLILGIFYSRTAHFGGRHSHLSSPGTVFFTYVLKIDELQCESINIFIFNVLNTKCNEDT